MSFHTHHDLREVRHTEDVIYMMPYHGNSST
jgi:hypothetical protein